MVKATISVQQYLGNSWSTLMYINGDPQIDDFQLISNLLLVSDHYEDAMFRVHFEFDCMEGSFDLSLSEFVKHFEDKLPF